MKSSEQKEPADQKKRQAFITGVTENFSVIAPAGVAGVIGLSRRRGGRLYSGFQRLTGRLPGRMTPAPAGKVEA